MTFATFSKSIMCKLRSNHSFNGKLICFSHLHHDFAMFFFNPQIWINLCKKLIKTFSSNIGFIYNSAVKMFCFVRNNFFPVMNSEKFIKPMHDGNIYGCKFQNCSMNNRKFSCFRFNSVDIKTSISINVTSKISKIQFNIHNVNSFAILYMERCLQSTVNDLGEWSSERNMRKSEHYSKDSEGDSKKFPRSQLYVSHKSNRLPVLNSAAARLGQAARETQDVLGRDNLEATASVINCVGKRKSAHVKFSLIDLELLAA